MATRKFNLDEDLSAALSETVIAASDYAGELHYEVIPLKNIEFDPENPRALAIGLADLPHGPKETDPKYAIKIREFEELSSLASTIKDHGILNPIIVYPLGQKYRLVAGERRCLASRIAGIDTIKANVLKTKPTDLKCSSLQWIENVERVDLKLSERLKNLKKIIHTYEAEKGSLDEFNPKFIKELLGCSWTNAVNYHAALSADEVIQDAIINDKIKSLEKAALIAKIDCPDLKAQALQACIAGESFLTLKGIASKQTVINDKNYSVPTNTRKKKGRTATRVNLGHIENTSVIKNLIFTVLKDAKYKKFSDKFSNYDWNDYTSVSEAFKSLLNIIRQIG